MREAPYGGITRVRSSGYDLSPVTAPLLRLYENYPAMSDRSRVLHLSGFGNPLSTANLSNVFQKNKPVSNSVSNSPPEGRSISPHGTGPSAAWC